MRCGLNLGEVCIAGSPLCGEVNSRWNVNKGTPDDGPFSFSDATFCMKFRDGFFFQQGRTMSWCRINPFDWMLNQFRTLVHQIACAVLCASKDTPAVYLRICSFEARTLPLFSSSQLYSRFSTSTINPGFPPQHEFEMLVFFSISFFPYCRNHSFFLAFQSSKRRRV